MKKNLLFLVPLFTMFVALFSSCTSTPSGAKLLPEESAVVMSLHVDEMVKSSGLELTAQMLDELHRNIQSLQLDPQFEAQLLALVDNPRKSGVDFTDPIFLAMPDVDRDDAYFTGSIRNIEDFSSLMEVTLKNLYSQSLRKYGSDSNLRFAQLSPYIYLMFSDDAFLIRDCYDSDPLETLARHFQSEKNFSDSPAFNDLMHADGLARMIISFTGGLKQQLISEFSRVPGQFAQLADMYADMRVLLALNVDKGLAEYSYAVKTGNRETAQFIKQFSSYLRKIDGESLKYIDRNNVFTAAFNLHAEAFIETITTYMPELTSDIYVARFLPLVSTLDGDIFLTLDGRTIGHVPCFSLYAKTSDGSLPRYLAELSSDEVEEYADNQWRLTAAATPGVFGDESGYLEFGYKEGYSYFHISTNNTYPCQPASTPMDDEKFSGRYTSAILHMGHLLSSPLASEAMKNNSDAMLIRQFLSPIETIEYTSTDKLSGSLRVVMTDKDQSPLKPYVFLFNQLIQLSEDVE